MFIPYNKTAYEIAVEEQRLRAPHMLTKYANSAARKAGQIRGLAIEHHVSDYFRSNYPDNFLEADNYQIWNQPCGHDFKLRVCNEILKIDVTGPKKDGTFGSYSQKPSYGVDYHIVTEAVGFVNWNNIDFEKGFNILGVVSSRRYVQRLDVSNIGSLKRWLKYIGLE